MSIFGAFSAKPTKDAAATAAQAIGIGATLGKGHLDEGYARASDAYGRAATTFGDLAGSYGGGSKLYQDALGVNGADASDAARKAYTTSAGYGFNMDQGLQALSRARAVNGTLASGNADTDAMKFASGLASQDYGNWLANLSGLDTKRFQATTGEAGTYGALGGAALSTGAAKAGIETAAANGVAQGAYKVGEAYDRANANTFGAVMGGLNLASNLAGKAFSIFG